MHPRSNYTSYIDFRKLAEDCPRLTKYVTESSKLDFKNPDAVRELAKSLLKRDFNLDVELPEDRLCPMVPNRLNYILWIQDLLDSTGDDPTDSYDPSRKVYGLDIGTGASCIYPLLGCAQRQAWNMIGTDIDDVSLQTAKRNVAQNSVRLGDRIRVYASTGGAPLFPLQDLEVENLDFTMCNPPFYDSIDSLFKSAKHKALPPSSACTGTTVEMVYSPAGELGFAKRMIIESLDLREKITWYTIQLGLLSSVASFVSELKKITELHGNWAVMEFSQGTTKRWAVAWSFRDRRPSQDTIASTAHALKGSFPFPTEVTIGIDRSPGETASLVKDLIRNLDSIQDVWLEKEKMAFVEVAGNVWSRAARRAKARGDQHIGVDTNVALGFSIKILEDGIKVRWRRGKDAVLFESLCGMVKRKLQQG